MNKEKNDRSHSNLEKQSVADELIDSKQMQIELDERAIHSLVDHVNSKLENCSLNKNGIKGIEKLYNKFEYDDIIDAINISASQYLTYDSDDNQKKESVEIFINKIGGILNLKNRPPIDSKIAYVKGICRNRFNYWDERRGTQILYEYLAALRNYDYSEDAILRDFEEEVIPKAKYLSNWSQWRNCMEGWTEDLHRFAKEREASKQEPEPPIQEINESKYIAEKRKGVTIAKNYLPENEIKRLERTVSGFFDYIENIIENRIEMKMEDMANSVDKFLSFNEYKILPDKGKVSRTNQICLLCAFSHYKIRKFYE